MAELNEAIDALFRRDRARVIAGLVRAFGSIDAAEEAFQEAVLSALKTWPAQGVPTTPAAWLTTAAKNFLRDALRHRRIVEKTAPLFARDDVSERRDSDAVTDDQLRLIFTCCHPALQPENQVALTLKVIAGFTTEELARAFLCAEATMAQRIARAKRTIDEKRLPYVVPDRSELEGRLAAVLAVIYLIFNEGYTSRRGPLMKLDLQTEALRLGRLLGELLPTEGEVFGLYALMALASSRAATRTDADGNLLLLPEQPRTRWDRGLITEGLLALQRARAFEASGAYTLQAEISACHATAETWEHTDWRRILACYDSLLALSPSAVVALNRAVAVCMLEGPLRGLQALTGLEDPLRDYHLFYATRADFQRRLGGDARPDYERALALASNDSERAFLQRRLAES